MSKGLIFTSEDGKKEFHITASGPIDARIVLSDYEEFPMIPIEDVKPLMAKFLFSKYDVFTEPYPKLSYVGTSTTSNVIDNHSRITTDIYNNLGDENNSLTEYEGILWQIAKDNLFTTDIVEYSMSGVNTKGKVSLDLDASKAVGLGLIGDIVSETGKTVYYARCRYFKEGKPSEWSEPIDFTIGGNYYNAPSITSELEEDKSRINIECPLDSPYQRHPLTGGIIIHHTDYSVKLGKLEEPEYINVYFGRDLTKDSKPPMHYKVPYQKGSITVYPKMLGDGDESPSDFIIQPLKPFNYYITYEGKDNLGNYITSEPSNILTSTFPRPQFFPKSFKLLQGSSKIFSIPTIVIEDIITDYNYLEHYASYKRERLNYLENHPGTTEEPLFIEITIHIKDFKGLLAGIISKCISSLDIKTDMSLNLHLTIDKGRLQTGREYNFEYTILVHRGPKIGNQPHYADYDSFTVAHSGNASLKKVRIKSLDNIETEKFVRPKATYPSSSSSPKFNALYGEIIKEGDFGLMPDINYRGYIQPKTTYYLYDEVVIGDKLYITVAKEYTTPKTDMTKYIPSHQHFREITPDNHTAIYKSGLPTYEWLAKRIGLPYRKDVFADKEGNIIQDEAITRIMNEDSGWLKCANYAKQHIYIAKRPLVSNISFRELQRRFLTGEYSRTIRIGLNYYSVRLLEVAPTSSIDPTWKSKSNVENPANYQNEFELYQQLFKVVFGSYQPEDLGLDSETPSKTFISKGVLNTSSRRDNNNNLLTTVKSEEYSGDERDIRSSIHFYRPVLELIRYDNLPLLKSKELPGSLTCSYDKWSDTGYYGQVSSSSFMTPEEVKSVFNLDYLQVNKEPISYHKFYYHGLTVYIPNRPIGMIPKEDLKTFIKSGLIYGTDSNTYNFRGSKYIMSLPNLQPTYYMDKHRVNNHEAYVTAKEGLQHVHDDSIIGGLVNRISNIFKDLIPGDEHRPAYHNDFIQDITKGLDNSVNEGIYLKDLILDKNLVDEDESLNHYSFARFKDGKVLTGTDPLDKEEYNSCISLWPVFITETADITRDFSYPTLVPPVPTITYEKKKVVKYELKPKRVKRERQIQKVRKEKYPVEVTIDRPIDTGRHRYEDTTIEHPDIGFNLAFSFAKKTDTCYFTKPLYDRSMINIRYIGGNYIGRWSSRIRNLDDYLLKSFILQSVKQGYRYPIPLNKKFSDAREVKTYLKSLLVDDLTVGTLTNNNYERIQTLGNKYPIGLFYGTVSSRELVYPVPRWYSLYPDDNKDMVRYPMVIQDNSNNWYTDVSYITNDAGDKIHIPLMSNYLPYEDFSPYGKLHIVEPIVRYIMNTVYKDRVNIDTVEELMESVRKEYVFGIFGLDMKTAKVMEGSINEGKPDTPKLTTMDGLLPEFLSVHKKLKDVLNPIPVVTYETITTTEWKEREVIYFELEEYEETIYQEVRVEKEIEVPVITYVEP